MYCNFDLNKATTLIISVEKFMYGIVFVRLSHNEDGIDICYTAIADGGEVCAEGSESYENKSLIPVFQHILDSEYPNEENDESSYSWGFQIGDKDDNQIAEIERAYWGEESMYALLLCLENVIENSDSIYALRNIIDF